MHAKSLCDTRWRNTTQYCETEALLIALQLAKHGLYRKKCECQYRSQGDASDKGGASDDTKGGPLDAGEVDFRAAGSDWVILVLEAIFHSIALAAPFVVTLAILARGVAALLWSEAGHYSQQYAWYKWCWREVMVTRRAVIVLIALVNLVRCTVPPLLLTLRAGLRYLYSAHSIPY